MKNTVKILRIIALAAVIGFFMAACSSDDEDSSDPPKQFITLTNIPSTYNGMIGALRLSPTDSSGVTVYSTEEKISGDSSTFPLFNWKNEKPWEGSGNFNITIYIFRNTTNAANGTYEYAGVINETSITETTTTLEWSSFAPKSNIIYQFKPAR